MKSSFILRVLLSAITLLNIEPTHAYSFKPKKDLNKLHIQDLETESVHADFSDPCCDSTKHKKDCTTQKICSIISKLNVVKSQIATIDSNIDNGFATVQAELDEIAEVQLVQSSQIDDCCFSLASSIDVLTTDVEEGFADAAIAFAALAAQDASILSKIDSCCESLNSKIDVIVCGSCDLSSVTSQLDSVASDLSQCCFTLNSKIDGINSDPFAVSSQLDLCCFQLNSSLDSLALEVEDCCLTLNSKIDGINIPVCDLSTVNSKLDALTLEVEACCSTINSKLDAVNVEVEECCITINSKLDVVESDITDCCLTLNSKLDVVESEIADCCVTVNSKLDTLNEDMLTVSSKIDLLGQCNAIPIVGITTITASGHYCLAQNLVSTSGPVITIRGPLASNIVIDLNGHDLKTQLTPASAIFTDAAFTYSNIEIFNGTVSASTSAGVNINPNASTHYNINIHDISVTNAIFGVFANTTQNLTVENCNFSNNNTNVQISNCSNVQVLKTTSSFSNNGILASSSNTVLIQGCICTRNIFGLQLNIISDLQIEESLINNNTIVGIAAAQITNAAFKDSSFDANQQSAGGSINNVTNLTIQNCSACNNAGIGFTFNSCQNVLMQSSLINGNANLGLFANNANNVQLENTSFNDNSTAGITASGAQLQTVTDFKAIECSFSTTGTTQLNGCNAIGLRNAVFENCIFNGNRSFGALINSGAQSSRFIKFIGCQANDTGNNGASPSGFRAIGNSGDIVFDSCFMGNNQNGITIQTNVAAGGITIVNSIAQANAQSGFNLLGGVGLLKENQALNNTVCGYNNAAIPASNYKFVANVGMSNGTNPAGVPANGDTNYCLAGVASTFVPNGPGLTPFRQVNLDTPPTSYWNNITL